ncbi:hypothetical protein HN51_007504, partial [Arachis hypogaea]
MANGITHEPSPSMLVRWFNALLPQCQGYLKAEEIVWTYGLLLSELTSNVNSIIIDFTIIAGQQRKHAKGITDAICNWIFEVPADKKLPSPYLLDSIVKNFGQEYVKHFSLRLPQVGQLEYGYFYLYFIFISILLCVKIYCEAYRQVQPNLHSALQCLFGTWSKIFPPSVLSNIEAQLQSSLAVNNQQSFANHLGLYDFRGLILGAHVIKPQSLQQMEHSSSIMDNVGGDKLDSTKTV